VLRFTFETAVEKKAGNGCLTTLSVDHFLYTGTPAIC
jgi:hypothetical protein